MTQGRAIVDDAEFSAPMAESRDTRDWLQCDLRQVKLDVEQIETFLPFSSTRIWLQNKVRGVTQGVYLLRVTASAGNCIRTRSSRCLRWPFYPSLTAMYKVIVECIVDLSLVYNQLKYGTVLFNAHKKLFSSCTSNWCTSSTCSFTARGFCNASSPSRSRISVCKS